MIEIWKEGKTSKEGNARGIWKERMKETEEYGKKKEYGKMEERRECNRKKEKKERKIW